MSLLRNRAAFTLVELLTVIAIVGILSALTIVAVTHVRGASRSVACQSNLRQIWTAMNVYAIDHHRRFPPSGIQSPYTTWYQILLGSGGAEYQTNYLGSVQALACPEGDYGTATGVPLQTSISYAMASLPVWTNPVTRTDDNPDFFSTRLNAPGKWPLVMDGDTPRVFLLDNPTESSPVRERFTARHDDKANVVMADGHIEQVAYGDTRWSQSTLNRNNYYTP